MGVTEAFYEEYELAASIAIADHSTAQELAARLFCGNYTEIVVVIHAEGGSGNALDIDVEEANALTAGTLQGFGGGTAKDVALADADTHAIVRLRTAEFSAGFDYLNIEATPAGARMFGINIFGRVKNAPAPITNWDTVVDLPS